MLHYAVILAKGGGFKNLGKFSYGDYCNFGIKTRNKVGSLRIKK